MIIRLLEGAKLGAKLGRYSLVCENTVSKRTPEFPSFVEIPRYKREIPGFRVEFSTQV